MDVQCGAVGGGDELRVVGVEVQAVDREVEGVDLLRYREPGLVAELIVMMRPASGLAAVRDAVGARLEALGAADTAR